MPPDPALPVPDARAVLRHAGKLGELAGGIGAAHGQLRRDVESSFNVLREQMVRRELRQIPVTRLREVTDGRLRIGPLEQVGLRTVLDVFDSSTQRLLSIQGVGAMTANQAVAAARQVATAVRDGLRIRVDLDPADTASTGLIVALHRLGGFEARAAPLRQPAQRLAGELAALAPMAAPIASRVRKLFTGRPRRAEAAVALARVAQLAQWAESTGLGRELSATRDLVHVRGEPAEAWRDFERRSPEYYGLLGEVVELGPAASAPAGFLPADVVERVNAHPLDDALRRVSVRGYQAFGARFALAQQRVIIGDEMGLGKTIEAIAAIAHLKATGHRRFLVVCPASVLNWTREIADRSELRAYRMHGIDRASSQAAWQRHGDVGVTTLDSLHTLSIPDDLAVDMLVVDEAHYVKNPHARRSQAVREWTNRVGRVLFLTGTPMENRVDEFKCLVDYLRPGLAPRIDGKHAVAGADAFRRVVAPVYLRRNQEDVLTELPDLVRSDDWVEFGRADFLAYRQAVLDGNFMAMRRAAYAPGTQAESAKLRRLLEIVDESAANGRKVVIFSYFRDVLSTVGRALAATALGPIAGDVPPVARQVLVDRFSAIEGHAVLLAQIQAGGVGLNIQAANVVVICEPQVKPTLEEQAIARLHRMGQVRSVQAHRLVVTDSVDERMIELLAVKSRLFDDYARRSEIAETSPDAVDISEVELARQVVAAEQERLARDAMASYSDEPA